MPPIRTDTSLTPLRVRHSLFKRVLIFCSVMCVGVGILGTGMLFWSRNADEPAQSFPVQSEFLITEGATADMIITQLAEKQFIRSSLYAEILMRTTFKEAHMRSGSYTFTEPLSTTKLLTALTEGIHATPLISVTFPEGFQVQALNTYLPKHLQDTNVESLRSFEGYLFPDTYFIESDDTLEELTLRMRAEYEAKMAPLRDSIATSSFSETEIIIIASLLEREANDDTSMRMVSGIIQNRLDIGMPLQIDATLDYLLDKASHELTLDDLEIDSPYNTYVYKGLPPTPIANPGLTAIRAALEPTASSYLYYLTDDEGVFHYAETHEEHTANKARYLR